MLLTKDEVTGAMNLTTLEVRNALKEGGYSDTSDITGG